MPRGRRKKNQASDDYQEAAPATSNSQERVAIFREMDSALAGIEARLAGLKEEEKEQYARLKPLGVKIKIYKSMRGLAHFDDEGERDQDVETYREVYTSLAPGKQMSLLHMDGASIKNEKPPVSAAYDEGVFAKAENPEALNPWPPGTEEHTGWQEGFMSDPWPPEEQPENVGGNDDQLAKLA